MSADTPTAGGGSAPGPRSPRRRAGERPGSGRERLWVALDVEDLDAALALADALAGEVGGFKVGLELFAAHGPAAVAAVAERGPVFLDLKLHDIPTTVERAARRLAVLEPALLTVHAGGGAAMMRAAVAGLAAGGGDGRVVAVTVLTSQSDAELAAVNAPPAAQQVPALARLAVDAGAPGLVCAPRDLERIRAAVGAGPWLVTPGIRPAGAGTHDHARSAAPGDAVAAGADVLVVGRPITRADDPVAAARAIAREAAGP